MTNFNAEMARKNVALYREEREAEKAKLLEMVLEEQLEVIAIISREQGLCDYRVKINEIPFDIRYNFEVAMKERKFQITKIGNVYQIVW